MATGELMQGHRQWFHVSFIHGRDAALGTFSKGGGERGTTGGGVGPDGDGENHDHASPRQPMQVQLRMRMRMRMRVRVRMIRSRH